MKYLCGLLILFTWIPFSVFGQGSDAPGVPSIHVSEPSFQFESVVSGQEVNHDYIVKNTGTAELEITGVKTG